MHDEITPYGSKKPEENELAFLNTYDLIKKLAPEIKLPTVYTPEYRGLFARWRESFAVQRQLDHLHNATVLQRARFEALIELIEMTNEAKARLIEHIKLSHQLLTVGEQIRLECLTLKTKQEEQLTLQAQHRLQRARAEKELVDLFLPPTTPVVEVRVDKEREQLRERLGRMVAVIESITDLDEKQKAARILYPHAIDDVEAIFDRQRQEILMRRV